MRNAQVMRLIADGTGRSPAEARLLVAWTAASLVVAGVLAIGYGVVRLIDFLADA
ncbi:hypothetical protein [Nocardioides sp. W7]|uniref:hypothetical protein n=1 Tax=Nocardioides sp. W7 TaxID=2931390 RepID=UPI001FD42D97|nr:hypothetical protein [Nocardioides sp. W7]